MHRYPRLLSSLAPACAAAGVFLACSAPPVFAQEPGTPFADRPSVYVQAGRSRYDTNALTVGLTLPWQWKRELWGGELHGYWDLYASRWSYDAVPDGHGSTTLIGLTPTLRLLPDGPGSRWFAEAGIGATVARHRYHTPGREFSTRFNFASHLGVGLRLGAQQRHELLLRLQHVSNAGIKHPNPGANFLQLRYALHF